MRAEGARQVDTSLFTRGGIMGPADLESGIRGVGVASRLTVEQLIKAKNALLAEKGTIPKRFIGIADTHRQRMESDIDAKVAELDRQKQIHLRRAKAADEGVLQHGPEETGDADHMKAHGHLVGPAIAAKRCRYEGMTDDRHGPTFLKGGAANPDLGRIRPVK